MRLSGARSAGILYLITIFTSIPAVFFLEPILKHSDFVLGSGPVSGVLLGNLLDMVNALACVGTAVALFPIIRKQHESLAVGFLASRLLEAAIIFIGTVSLLAIVTLRLNHNLGSGGAANLVGNAQTLLAVRNWTFLLGPGLIPALNALLLGTALLKSGLVPRLIPIVGLIGAPMLVASAMCTFFGVFGQDSSFAAVLALPIALWELSLGLWLCFKGVKLSS
jgi:Domain of unknown function (DUF4386)